MHRRLLSILDNPSDELPYADFEILAGWGESRQVERKSMQLVTATGADSLKKAVSKFTSAVANYDGGALLLGVDDSTGALEANGIEDVKGKGTFKEWLEDLVSGATTPTVPTCCVKRVKATGDGYLFLIVVGASTLAPHQASDFRYYGRIDGKSRPINGLMVLDIVHRQEEAALKPSFHVTSMSQGHQDIIAVKLQISSPVRVARNVLAIADFTTAETPTPGNWASGQDRFTGLRADLHADLVYPDVTTVWPTMKFKKVPRLEGDLMVVAENARVRRWHFALFPGPDGYEQELTPAE